jgi:CheY-like chemotaxis protein
VNSKPLHILLADDDVDDCNFFKRALEELPITTQLTMAHDGEQLTSYLAKNINCLPDTIFLDLSMPRKTGFECLTEIKQNERLKDIPVFVFSTSFTRDLNYERTLIGTLHSIGALEYIRKPGDFEQLKKSIHNALIKITEKKPLDGHMQMGSPLIQNAENVPNTSIKIQP